MAEAKIEVKIGSVSFSGEGSEKWLGEQLQTIIQEAPKLSALAPAAASAGNSDTQPPSGPAAKTTQSLASHLTAKQVGDNQVKRFLVAADWLRLRGEANLTTAAVTKALSDNHQAKLSNPAQCLNGNTTKGFTEKTGKGFYITPEGLKSLGHAA